MWVRICALIKKEFIAFWNDPKSRIMIVWLPIMLLLVIGPAITLEAKNIKLAVWDRAQTLESRELVARFAASPRFEIVRMAESLPQLRHWMDTQSVQAGLLIDNDFSDKIKRGETAKVLTVFDGRQTNSAAIMSAYVQQIVAAYAQELSANVYPRVAKEAVDVEIRNWYNPNLEYKWYLQTVLIALIAMVMTLLLTALSVARERETGTFDQLIVSPLSSFEILVGKMVPPLLIVMALVAMMTVIVIWGFQVPFVGSLWLFAAVMPFALLSIVGVGLFISSVVRTQQQAILGVITFQLPAALLSGFLSPVEDMALPFKIIGKCNPLYYFINLVQGIFLKNMNWTEALYNLWPMMLMAVITLSLAGWMFNKRLD